MSEAEAQKKARRHANCEVLEGDFTSHDFSSMHADAVILIGALVHVPHDDFARIFSKIAAALRDGGLMLITLKEGADGADGAQGDNRAHGADGRIFYLHHDSDLRRTFAALGFDVLDFKQSGLKRVLFIAHRENILCRARESFAKVMRNPSFGSILGGGNGKVSEYAPGSEGGGAVFAMIQTLSRGATCAHLPRMPLIILSLTNFTTAWRRATARRSPSATRSHTRATRPNISSGITGFLRLP